MHISSEYGFLAKILIVKAKRNHCIFEPFKNLLHYQSGYISPPPPLT